MIQGPYNAVTTSLNSGMTHTRFWNSLFDGFKTFTSEGSQGQDTFTRNTGE